MYLGVTNWDDIYDVYGTSKCRGLSDRLFKVLYMHRQPRPHVAITIYANRRARLIQQITPREIVTDFVMDTKRKRRTTNAFGRDIL